MFAQERHHLIIELLEKEGSVRVASLASRLQVTEETVRRDLERLDNHGKLRRTHGGALALDAASREQPFDVRRGAQQREKDAIARLAAEQVHDGEIIAIDGSSTAFAMARALPELSITVVTTSMPVVMALAQRSRIRVVCAGGTLDRTSMSLSGALTEQVLDHYNIHRLFLSCAGVDAEHGLNETAEGLAEVKRRLMARADRTYLLADHTKFGVHGGVTFAGIDQIDALITDHSASADQLTRIRDAGVVIHQAN
jgi:DeoR/GlpR family transcriptional regulator of sugar metabolism